MTTAAATTPVALTIAGSDSSGGAGIQADLKTFAALGVYGASAITALTAQNTTGVSGIHLVPPASSPRRSMRSSPISMSGPSRSGWWRSAPRSRRSPTRCSAGRRPCRARSGDGGDLGRPAARPRGRRRAAPALIPRAAILTPNLPEAAALLDEPVAAGAAAIEAQGRRLLALGCPAVLIKGGHGGGSDSVDYLVSEAGTLALSAPRSPTRNTHGTGCSLSSAIAAGLARGEPLETAVRHAKAFVSAAIAAADRFSVGHGHGPIHHFHEYY